MTYDAREISSQDGAPVELYRFAIADRLLLFTSSEADVVIGDDTYASANITRSDLETSTEEVRNNLQLTTPRNFDIADLFRIAPPSDIIALTVMRYHRGDAEQVVLWIGRVTECAFKGASAEINCEPVSTSLNRTGLRRLYQRQCPHVLYGAACGLAKTSFATTTTVSAISGLTLTVASLGSYPYAGGFVEWPLDDGQIERRFITAFSGLALTLSQPFTGIAVTDSVTVFPGCDHTTATCSGVYSNLPNYGGFPLIPTKNPFSGTPVY